MALAIYTRCPVLFDDLKKLDILQLPCRRSLERVTAKRTVEEGIHEERIIKQLTLFNQFKTTAVLSGRPEPLGVGELILFDETKGIPVAYHNSHIGVSVFKFYYICPCSTK